jgi:hypothetical protein
MLGCGQKFDPAKAEEYFLNSVFSILGIRLELRKII